MCEEERANRAQGELARLNHRSQGRHPPGQEPSLLVVRRQLRPGPHSSFENNHQIALRELQSIRASRRCQHTPNNICLRLCVCVCSFSLEERH
jgi:hypothetical protein